ncbi:MULTISPECIES: hypothetical protein [Vibrio]|uniref:Uncharacterized protein n=1 Tax=Vibrio tasmaniensis TaxID=212663 RepID=A0A2N7NN60_9VIBR|nr:hypothetical protein [Vibrio tasmaniensis]PMO83678.1 hypothetical protein BCT01_24520 [Vibrio tasmaniensis]PMP17684.1 hypothetical protein BCS92_24475 [Vibrio tasmaniensis]TKG27885.1 hypothetical protein FC057_22830 [Vibrio tasmaniensis]TKG35432.1 hypothetical protein FC063_24810 [Vibrio tasmaniensis]TKG41778.1 hypothetical protein FC061_23420 [Vibrio tasmaniensis]
MVTKISLLAVACGLAVYFASNHFDLSVNQSSVEQLSIDQETALLVTKPETQSKPVQLTVKRTVGNGSLEAPQAVEPEPIADADLVMSESLTSLHLTEFSDYLGDEQASEHTILAFYTDSRWYEFYERVGYSSEDIHQLIAFRSQYLADSSQLGKEYYYHRWSDAPHRALSDTVADELMSYLGNGQEQALTLSSTLSSVASKYGITTSLVERIAKTYLLGSIGRMETTSELFNSSFDPQVDVIKLDSNFVGFLVGKAGYTQEIVVIDKGRLMDTYSSNNN